MFDQFTYITILLYLSGGLATVIGWYALVRAHEQPRQYVTTFVGLTVIAIAIWSFAYGMLLISSDQTVVYWYYAVWVGAVLLPITWPAFTLSYVEGGRWFTRKRLVALTIVPTVAILMLLAHDYHDLFVVIDHAVRDELGYPVEHAGPAYDLFVGYSYAIVAGSVIALAHEVSKVSGNHRRQASVLLVSGTVPVVFGLMTVYRVSPLSGIDLTPIAFTVTSVGVAWAVLEYRLFDLVPLARETVFEEIVDPIFVLDGRRTIIDCNDAARGIVPMNEPIGRHVEVALPGIERAIDEAGPNLLPISQPNQEWYEVREIDVEAPDDTNEGSVITLTDVTDRRRTERLSATMIENVSDVIVIHEESGVMRYVSPSSEHVLGYAPEELEGELPVTFVHPDDEDAVVDSFVRASESGTERFEYRVQHADGTWRTVETIAKNLLDDQFVKGVLTTTRDVSERRRYEQRLEVMNRVLRHDMRNELNVISGYVELVLDSDLDRATEEKVLIVKDRTDKLISLSEKARNVDYGLHTEESVSAEIVDIVARTVQEIRRRCPEATIDVETPEEIWVTADEQIATAIDALLENAIEHNEGSEPTIAVRIEPTTVDEIGYVDSMVADDGPGIPVEERQTLKAGTESALSHASGIGLWVVHWLVEGWNGEVLFEEHDSGGMTVTIRLLRATIE